MGRRRPAARTVVLCAAGALGVALAGGCHSRVRFSPQAVAEHRMLDDAGPDFMLGAATSAHQIEGGTHNDWTEWEGGHYPDGKPHVQHGDSAARAADSWNLWRADLAALQLIGANTYRLGIEWSRLEPSEGVWDEAAAARYREMLQAFVAAGVRPMVTLYHFTLPLWVARQGGWEWAGAPEAFAAFAARAGAAFGASVDYWCTINEPNVYVAKGFLAGQWPPGVQDPRRAGQVLRALMKAHALATAALRTADVADADGDGRATRIGIAQNLRIFDPATPHPVDGLVAGYAGKFYNDSFLDSVVAGRIRISIPGEIDIDEPYPALAGTFDYLGVNYYTREYVIGHLIGPEHYVPSSRPDLPRNDMGWEIYPEGLYRVLARYAIYGWPLFVTENGMADNRGDRRGEYIRAHIYALDRARGEGINVIGYLYWSLIDNFEWSYGYRARFGLFSIDFEFDPALTRRPTPAVAVFQEAARNLGTLK